MSEVNENDFLAYATSIIRSSNLSSLQTARKFKMTFGTTAIVCSIIWNLIEIERKLPSRSSPLHLLFALFFLRKYETEEFSTILTSCTEKTFRKWVHIYVPLIADLELVI